MKASEVKLLFSAKRCFLSITIWPDTRFIRVLRELLNALEKLVEYLAHDQANPK